MNCIKNEMANKKNALRNNCAFLSLKIMRIIRFCLSKMAKITEENKTK